MRGRYHAPCGYLFQDKTGGRLFCGGQPFPVTISRLAKRGGVRFITGG